MRPTDDGDTGTDDAYTLVGTNRTFRVNSDNTFTPVIIVTARSHRFEVTYTWTMLASTWDIDGGPPAIALKTVEVNAICAADHVQGFRTEQDQDPSGVLYNYAVVTVGTDDDAITDEVRIRMDKIGLPAAFGAIAATWNRLAAAGAVA